MSFEKLTKAYLANFQKSCLASWEGGAKSIEMATRPIVHQFICDLVSLCKKPHSEAIIHHDISYTKYDRPDWRIEDEGTFGIFCFGDHKNLSLGKKFQLSGKEKSQINRYLAFGRPVFVFDGIEFLFLYPEKDDAERLALIDKKKTDIAADWSRLPINGAIETKFRHILENPGFRKWSEPELIEQLAIRCRFISDEVALLLAAPVGSGMSEEEEGLLKALKKLKSIIISHHDSSLRTNHACADFIAQVLTFGLFYAHTRYAISKIDPSGKREKIREFWKVSTGDDFALNLRPFKAIVDSLSTPLKKKNVLSDWYDEVLGVLAHAEYMGTDKGPQDFHTLFEIFLEKFDKKTKFDRGAFYTPQVLSNWLVLASEEVSKQSLGSSIAELAVNIIDPCCGTGSFLEAVHTLFDANDLRRHQVTGFEILPAPYALSHYRLTQIYTGSELGNVRVLLTDTLSDSIRVPSLNAENDFDEEKKAAVLSCQSALRLVIGNPPSSNHPVRSSPRSVIEGLMEDFRPPKVERTDRQNIQKALNNEAFRFLRWCSERVIESELGVLALVMPGSLSEGISFKYARKWLIENFKDIYVIKIDEDARRGDATQSLFDVLQGRIAIIATYDKSNETLANVYFSSIANMKLSEKEDFLSTLPEVNDFEIVTPSEPNWFFSQEPSFPKELWEKCIPLNTRSGSSVFRSKCSAIKLAPSSTLFHTHKPTLVRRTSELSGKQRSLSIRPAIEKWFKGQARPPSQKKFTDDVKEALSKINSNSDVKKYLFRPFTTGWVIENDKLFSALSAAPGGGTRARPEIRKAFSDKAIGIAVAPAPADLGATLKRFACFCWNLPDNDIAARGNAMIYCNVFPEKGKDGLGPSRSNFDEKFLSFFEYSTDPGLEAMFYIYAVMSSAVYLDTFEGVLYRASDPSNPPRIPVASSCEDRECISNIGKSIAECESLDFEAEILVENFVEFQDDIKTLKLSKNTYDEPSQSLVLSSKDGREIKIRNVPSAVAALSIAGHNVLDKWLRERTFNYLRRDFNENDLSQLLKLLSRLSTQINLIDQVDKRLGPILSNEDIATID